MSVEILDLNFIAELKDEAFGPEEEDFKDLLKTYLEGTQKALPEIFAAIEQENWEKVGRLAHTFKGSSANVGAAAMAIVLKEAELLAKSGKGQKEDFERLAQDAQQKFQQTKEELKARFQLSIG